MSDGLAGLNPDGSPGPLLSRAMDDINALVGTLRNEMLILSNADRFCIELNQLGQRIGAR